MVHPKKFSLLTFKFSFRNSVLDDEDTFDSKYIF